MKHLSLFSGIGGLDLAAEWAGFETVAFVERDPYCQRVLAKHWPGVPCFDDVRAVSRAALENAHNGDAECGSSTRSRVRKPESGEGADHHAGGSGSRVLLVSGGFPCQPHSVAGKRQASADDRDLWPEFARVIREIRPRWVVAENVPDLLSSESGRFFGTVLRDLAEMGYSAGWGVWGACDVGALHRRDRVFIVAHAARLHAGREEPRAERERVGLRGESGDVADAERRRQSRPREHGRSEHSAANGDWEADRPFDGGEGLGRIWQFEPDVGRVAHGVPSRVDRLRALGNAVVPQQAYPLFKAIAEYERVTQYSQYSVKEET